MKLLLVLVLCLLPSPAQTNALDFLNHNRPLLDAHNCYPYDGKWADRIDRALANGSPVAIEQDIASYGGRAVVSHTDNVKGGEPLLRDYFFARVRPIVEKALAENDRAKWPLIVLHFDFKSNEAPLLHAVWDLLGEYEGWLTTAVKTADPKRLSPFDAKPILAITEDSDAQEEVFFRQVPVGGKLRVFGSAHTKIIPAQPKQEHDHLLATLPPAELLSEQPTNYRRWWNSSWYAVEEGGQRKAGDWTRASDARLRALVDHAHQLGYWIRFYTLDGFTADESRGWDQNYNFGSHEAVRARWNAAVAAGVNLIATDQYEMLGALLR
jgi:hypothetical protein